MPHPSPLPRDKDTLLREINATLKVKDIKSLYRLRDSVEVKWWEAGLILVLFVSALGFLATVILLLAGAGPAALWWLQRSMLFWFVPLTLSIVLVLEVLLAKINALRRLNEISTAHLEMTRKEIEALRRTVETAAAPAPDNEEKP